MAPKTPLPVARTRISIGSATADYTQTALAADTYVRVGRVRSMPGFGETYADITVEEVDDGRTRYGKGTASGVAMDIVCSRQLTDPGQAKMNAASLTALSYNLKMEIPNEAGTFDVVYFCVLVNSSNTGLGGPNDTQTVTYNCRPQEAPIVVPAT